MSDTTTAFTNQVAIITGGSSGLGLAITKALLQADAQVAVFDLKPHPETQEHPHAFFHAVDITQEEKVAEAITTVWKKFGRIDILVNSAGMTGITNIKTHETATENVRQVFDVNFMGSYFTSKHVLPYMLENKYGRILHIASIAGKEGNAGMLAYSASKAAVIGMTKVQGKEYAETGITINALAPAVIQTPMVDAMPVEQVRYMTDKIPMKRCGTLEEIANIALYIVSPKNSFTTAFTFDISGGRATY
jgi:NAD(P)-dependent dehydrogenase (short-subunit alcohol dehydrogenase family)